MDSLKEKISWSTQSRNLSDLVPAEYNPRFLSPKSAQELKASLDKFSLADPLVINADNKIIGGHQRYHILKASGETVVDVRVPNRQLAIEEERELNIRLNKNMGEWDFDLLANFDEDLLKNIGFDSKELDQIFQTADRPEDDVVPDNAPAICKRGEIYKLGSHRLMCGDSTSASDVALLMDGKKARICITDPPYGVSYGDKNKYLNAIGRGNCIQTPIENDHCTEQEIMAFWKTVFEIIRDQLMPEWNSYYIFGLQIQGMMMMMMIDAGLPYRHVIIWVKNNHVLGRCDYNYKHEPLFFGWTTKNEFKRGGEFQTSVWEVDKPHKSDLHPTMKPVRLMENCLLNSSDRDDICFEPFLGSGFTLIACEKTSRMCYGMEISEHYCDVIIKRFEDFTKQKAQKVN